MTPRGDGCDLSGRRTIGRCDMRVLPRFLVAKMPFGHRHLFVCAVLPQKEDNCIAVSPTPNQSPRLDLTTKTDRSPDYLYRSFSVKLSSFFLLSIVYFLFYNSPCRLSSRALNYGFFIEKEERRRVCFLGGGNFQITALHHRFLRLVHVS